MSGGVSILWQWFPQQLGQFCVVSAGGAGTEEGALSFGPDRHLGMGGGRTEASTEERKNCWGNPPANPWGVLASNQANFHQFLEESELLRRLRYRKRLS